MASITEVFPTPFVPVISIFLLSRLVSDTPKRFLIFTLVIFIRFYLTIHILSYLCCTFCTKHFPVFFLFIGCHLLSVHISRSSNNVTAFKAFNVLFFDLWQEWAYSYSVNHISECLYRCNIKLNSLSAPLLNVWRFKQFGYLLTVRDICNKRFNRSFCKMNDGAFFFFAIRTDNHFIMYIFNSSNNILSRLK